MPVTPNLNLQLLSDPTLPDYKGDEPTMDENLQKIDTAVGAGGGGLTAPWSQSGAAIQIQNDDAALTIQDSAAQHGVQFSIDRRGNADLTVSDNTGLAVDINSAGGVAPIGLPIDLSNSVGGVFPDIIDSTGSHGTAGQVLSSLGPGLGVKWIDAA